MECGALFVSWVGMEVVAKVGSVGLPYSSILGGRTEVVEEDVDNATVVVFDDACCWLEVTV